MPLYGAIVVIKRSGNDGSRYPLTAKECLIGSGPTCDIRVCVPSVAPEHCEINVTETKEVLVINRSQKDLCTLNNEQLPVGVATKLAGGDIIAVGDRCFRFECVPNAQDRRIVTEGSADALHAEVEANDDADRTQLITKCSSPPADQSENNTPNLSTVHKEDTPISTGLPNLSKEPEFGDTPKLSGMLRLAEETKQQQSPLLNGVSRIFRETKAGRSPKLAGLSRLFVEGKERPSPKYGGLSNMFMGSKRVDTPKLSGLSRLFHETRQQQSPKLNGVSNLFKEPRSKTNGKPKANAPELNAHTKEAKNLKGNRKPNEKTSELTEKISENGANQKGNKQKSEGTALEEKPDKKKGERASPKQSCPALRSRDTKTVESHAAEVETQIQNCKRIKKQLEAEPEATSVGKPDGDTGARYPQRRKEKAPELNARTKEAGANRKGNKKPNEKASQLTEKISENDANQKGSKKKSEETALEEKPNKQKGEKASSKQSCPALRSRDTNTIESQSAAVETQTQNRKRTRKRLEAGPEATSAVGKPDDDIGTRYPQRRVRKAPERYVA